MKRINSTLVRLPELFKEKEKDVASFSEDEIEERNLRSYNYGKRTGIPTLRDYILSPHSTTFKELALAEAIEKYGLDSEGILNNRHEFEKTFDDKKHVASVYPSKRYDWTGVLSEVKSILNNVKSDNIDSIHREKVRKIDGDTYISVEYILSHMERLKKEYKTRINDSSFVVNDAATDKKFSLDKKVKEMRVFFDTQIFKNISQKNANNYYLADSLKSNIASFLKNFEEWARDLYGIKNEGLEGRVEEHGELSDGTGVRDLFFPKSTKLSTGDIYKALADYDESNKKIVMSTGDLQIIRNLAFKETYEYKRGEAKITVNTGITDKRGKKGETIIKRIKSGVKDVREYQVYNNDGKVYVLVNDMIGILKKLTEKSTPPKTEVKIDFFPPPPQYLTG